MNKKLVFVFNIFLVLTLCVALNSDFASAQEKEEIDYSWGIVSSISSDSIVITEYDYITEEEKETRYIIDSSVSLVNAEDISDISTGDEAEIEYIIKDANRIAKIITIEKSSALEEYDSFEMLEEEDSMSIEEPEVLEQE
ncbi:MAG: hypothetical protein ISS45_01860 [Candidatus Omnitrophica bacterium]|nr:hypothetical protein [Candidatus Omnitrophota bacterium]